MATERRADGQVRAFIPGELGETPSVWRHDLMLALWWEETAPEYLGLYQFTLGAQPVGDVDIHVTRKGTDVYEVLPVSRLEEGLYCLHEDDPFRDVGMFEIEWCFRVMP